MSVIALIKAPVAPRDSSTFSASLTADCNCLLNISSRPNIPVIFLLWSSVISLESLRSFKLLNWTLAFSCSFFNCLTLVWYIPSVLLYKLRETLNKSLVPFTICWVVDLPFVNSATIPAKEL